MKDLKHLYYFENLLEEVNNDLVREGLQRGDIAIGGVCSLIPEVLLNLPGTFAVRLRAPRTGSIEMGTYYMTSLLCEGCRAYLERALEGGYEFLDCILAVSYTHLDFNKSGFYVNERIHFFIWHSYCVTYQK